jgi:hypothetical protein
MGTRGLLVAFICNHCPFVQHVRACLVALGGEYPSRGIGWVGINSNDAAKHPEDGTAKMGREPYTFPYLRDESQAVARAFDAACTPDFFLFDGRGRLAYRGQLDDARPGNAVAVTGGDLRAAMDALIAGRPVAPEQRPSLGCNIKWKD